MTTTNMLFDIGRPAVIPSRAESAAEERRRKQRLAYDATKDDWKRAVYEFAVEVFLPRQHEPFIFEVLSTAYEAYAKKHGKPLTVEKRAFAGLMARLLKENRIARTGGYGFRSQKNASPLYVSRIGE